MEEVREGCWRKPELWSQIIQAARAALLLPLSVGKALPPRGLHTSIPDSLTPAYRLSGLTCWSECDWRPSECAVTELSFRAESERLRQHVAQGAVRGGFKERQRSQSETN